MTTPFERRVKRLRAHVLKSEKVETYTIVDKENENGLTEQPISEDDEPTNIISIEDITKPEIIEILTQKGIEHNPRDKKEILYDLLIKGE